MVHAPSLLFLFKVVGTPLCRNLYTNPHGVRLVGNNDRCSLTRRGWVSQPLRAENPRSYDGCRTLNFDALMPLAPAGRHVYRI